MSSRWRAGDRQANQIGSGHRRCFRVLIAVGVIPMGIAASGARAADDGPAPLVRETTARRPPPANRTGGLSAVNFQFKVRHVVIHAGVSDALFRPVTTLPQDSFRVFEEGVEQQIVSFVQEDGPVSLGLLFDTSSSMKTRADASVEALKQLVTTCLPGDEFFLVQFADTARLLNTFTEPDLLFQRLGRVKPKGWTALLDAIALGASQMRRARNPRRVLLVLSDGGDNNSRFSESEIRSMVLETDLRLYAITLFQKPRILQQLADVTGGSVLIVQNLNDLPEVVGKLSAEIRSQYLLTYSPINQQSDGKYRRVRVDLAQPSEGPPLRITWRRGYYAPIE